MRLLILTAAFALVAFVASPAQAADIAWSRWAQACVVNSLQTTCSTPPGHSIATAEAYASTKITNTNTQDQQQKLVNQPNQTVAPSQTVKFENPVQDRMPGLAVAPGLTSAGTMMCAGSWSVALSGPMAALGFGKTTVETGCERRNNAAMLYQFGERGCTSPLCLAAIRMLMKNDEVAEAVSPKATKAAGIPSAAAADALSRVVLRDLPEQAQAQAQ